MPDKTNVEVDTTKKDSAEVIDKEVDSPEHDEETPDATIETGDDIDKEDSPEDVDTDKANEEALDAAIEQEQRLGKPDPLKAKDAFKKREISRIVPDVDDDTPLTKKDISSIEARIRGEMLEGQAIQIAQSITTNPKEIQLILLKWKNRTYPEGLSLSEQVEEAYVITHKNKILGENRELKRAIKNRVNVNRDVAGTHRDPLSGKEPKLPAGDTAAIIAAGFKFNTTSRQYEKKLPNGGLIIRGKNGATRFIPKQ